MFIGTVHCEVELGARHPAFEGLRFFLVHPEHEVEWEGPVVAIDCAGAEVGDMVVVALAPLGASLELPEDLPVEAAVVGVVSSITTCAEDGEDATVEGVPASTPRDAEEDLPRSDRGPRPERAPAASGPRGEEREGDGRRERRPRRRRGGSDSRGEREEPPTAAPSPPRATPHEPAPAAVAKAPAPPAAPHREPPAREQPAPHREPPAPHREQPVREREQPAREREQPAREREQPAREREQPAREPERPRAAPPTAPKDTGSERGGAPARAERPPRPGMEIVWDSPDNEENVPAAQRTKRKAPRRRR